MNKQFLKYIILFVAIVLLVAGFYRDEITIIWEKAANICLECIGIG